MVSLKKSSRLGRVLAAAVVAITTFAFVAQALQTVVVPNAAQLFYTLNAQQNSAAIFPVGDRPILLMGVCTTAGVRGVGHVSLLRSIGGGFLEWTGLESTAGSVITQGFSGAAGAHIVFLDFAHRVEVEVAGPTSIRVHNNLALPVDPAKVRSGNVTLIW